ncbi:MAG: hypothetical protein ACE5KV_06610 [Thermoplasmata archaeon]
MSEKVVTQMDVVGLGAINLDRFMLVERIAPLEKGHVRLSEDHPGGAASNTIVGLSRLEVETGLLGVLGEERGLALSIRGQYLGVLAQSWHNNYKRSCEYGNWLRRRT